MAEIKKTKTRYTDKTGVSIGHVKHVGWAHFDSHDRKVGPWYSTKLEIFSDHENYLLSAGWMKTTVLV